MSKKNKEEISFDDIITDSESPKKSPVSEDSLDKLFSKYGLSSEKKNEEIQHKEDWKEKRWIYVKEDNTEKRYDLKECSAQDFMNWVEEVWPIAKGKHDISNYKTLKQRQVAFDGVIKWYQAIKFPKM